MNIVIDTNIFISALIKDSLTRRLIVESEYNLLFQVKILTTKEMFDLS